MSKTLADGLDLKGVKTDADTAQTSANSAQTSANTAQTSANNAQSTANTALTTANNAIPLAQKAAANGVASLNGASAVVQDPASKGLANGVASLNGSSLVVQDPASKGLANGVASLDGAGFVPLAQLPSSVKAFQGTSAYAGTTPTSVELAAVLVAAGQYAFMTKVGSGTVYLAFRITVTGGDPLSDFASVVLS